MNSNTQTQSVYRQAILSIGSFFFKFRNALFPSIFLIIFFCFTPTLQATSPKLDRILTPIGIIIAISGALVRLAVIGFAYIRRGGKRGHVYAEELITGGLYSHCRNPMYVGNILIATGISILYGAPLMFFVVIPFFLLVYISIIATEENYLLQKFGSSYQEYCTNVPRFIPNFKGIRETISEHEYDWKKTLRSDYGTLSATLSGIIAILIWKSYHLNGIQEAILKAQSIGPLLALICLFYLTVYYLKHSGRLGGRARA